MDLENDPVIAEQAAKYAKKNPNKKKPMIER